MRFFKKKFNEKKLILIMKNHKERFEHGVKKLKNKSNQILVCK